MTTSAGAPPSPPASRTLVPPVVSEAPALRELRLQVRGWLGEQVAAGVFVPHVDTWLTRWDRDFSRELGRRGWLGMVVPREYGGQGRTYVERFVVTEELLVAGAPVAAHWVAERQIGPTLLRHGTEEQKRAFLPGISRGELVFGIGMSEPDSGSDLASVRTRAERDVVEGRSGWRLTGTKVWTSGAHEADAFFALARSAPLDPADRHAGLSQFVVDLHDPAVEVRPIVSMNGEHHFNEVHLGGVFVPDDRVLGELGSGWRQVTGELAFERSGPERVLSTFPLLAAAAGATAAGRLPDDAGLGRLLARTAGLHHMSLAVAAALQQGDDADSAAAAVKVLGTTLEGDVAEHVDLLAGRTGRASGGDDELSRLLDAALLQRPGFTLRGGTNEVLRGVVARALGLR
ncbi:acyl-CoA dehydrogenase family protein [Terracoccus luteus]|uniref:Alkylation response protein AidB-like acyl-CoA dehydrogenase n=1 Tax=Terracoccus luteus TaxID=53356 RepID=A0A839PUW9_9MICO|nr:acyl-CoA dehydrogenase family protein [Terracoccus luteus]MBB2987920.1 alkylation response protein AidB-like acyl-CoA dehydrogenase [Terracoccus luteus]MCP2173571.1 alkylation response protein AidB-like acyl-CoA dehydrogenase [Terracoccus luteus]